MNCILFHYFILYIISSSQYVIKRIIFCPSYHLLHCKNTSFLSYNFCSIFFTLVLNSLPMCVFFLVLFNVHYFVSVITICVLYSLSLLLKIHKAFIRCVCVCALYQHLQYDIHILQTPFNIDDSIACTIIMLYCILVNITVY